MNLNTPNLQNTFGVMYWQWAAASITNTAMFGNVASISDLANSGMNNNVFAGFYEFSSFMTNFTSTASPANVAAMSGVSLSSCATPPNCPTSFENLFYTYDVNQYVGSDPPTNSLFYIKNMQDLVTLGMSTPNIYTSLDQTYGLSFNLSSGWQNLTDSLGLTDQRQTYMIWLWL